MPLYSVWLKPDDEFVISVCVDAKSLAEAIDKGQKLDTRKHMLAKGVEWIDGHFSVTGVYEHD